DGSPLVDPPASGSSGELAEVVRGENPAQRARQTADHYRTGRHVDADRQCIGGADDREEPLGEEALDQFLHRRQQTGVMEADPPGSRRAALLPRYAPAAGAPG